LQGEANLPIGHPVSAAAPAPLAAEPIVSPAPRVPLATESARPDLVRIVHLTDLHYGFGFNRELWANVASLIKGLRPHVIIVTGDLVNSPWWWRFLAVRRELREPRQQTKSGWVLAPSLRHTGQSRYAFIRNIARSLVNTDSLGSNRNRYHRCPDGVLAFRVPGTLGACRCSADAAFSMSTQVRALFPRLDTALSSPPSRIGARSLPVRFRHLCDNGGLRQDTSSRFC